MKANAVAQTLINAGIIDNVMGLDFKDLHTYTFEAERNTRLEKRRDEAGAALKIATLVLNKQQKAKTVDITAIAAAQEAFNKAQHEVDNLETLTDPITDSKFVREFVNLAHLGLFGAILATDGKEIPLSKAGLNSIDSDMTDEELEADETRCHKPSDRLEDQQRVVPMTLDQAQINESVVWRIAEHYAGIEGNTWLRSFSRNEILKDNVGRPLLDSFGNKQVVRVTTEIIRPFAEWLKVEIEVAKKEDWEASLLICRRGGWAEYKTPTMGINEAMVEFGKWLDAVPDNKKGMTTTRRERIVAAVADRKWKNLLKAATEVQTVVGGKKALEQAMKDWIIFNYSPHAENNIRAIKASSVYQTLLVQRENDELVEQQEQQRLAADHQAQAMIRTQLQMGQLQFAMQQKTNAELQTKLQEQMAAVMAQLNTAAPSTAPVVPVLPAMPGVKPTAGIRGK